MPTHAYYGSCRVSKRPPTWRHRNERRSGTDSWTPSMDSRGERDGRHRRDGHRDRRAERDDHRDDREDSVHNNYGRVNNNYNINIRSFGDHDRSRHWNGNVLRDRNFNTHIRNRPQRDRFDNRRYSPSSRSSQSSHSSWTRSWVSSESNTNSFSDRPVDSVEDADETEGREYDDRENGYYGARQAYSDFSRGDVVQGHMRPTDRVCDESELRLGTIISTAVHEQARENTVSIDEFNKSLSGFGIVYSKYRKLIVVEEWTQHVVCIPLYSYNGRGLAGREALACEYFDVRDVDDPEPERGDTFLTLMAVRDEEWPMENAFVEGRTVAKLTEKITFYRTNKCSIEGRLEEESLSTLIPPYLKSCTNPLAKFLTRSQTGSPTGSRTDNPTGDQADNPADDGVEEKEEGEI
ncbi:hypothetical protein CEP54_005654 [Fusarium duplospermum]|uniref:DUF6590 domain-containing protein n=1 Tax=Fusarium duplospermum TaxID=1325734 RepID=A0A428QB04_9HYPO|nr:hypothetical protein CEP54_005654 [Fusarium duplospermum]